MITEASTEDEEYVTRPRELRKRRRRRGLDDSPEEYTTATEAPEEEMSTKTTSTTTTEASVEDRKRVQVVKDNNRGVSGSTTVPVGWQQQRSVDFPCFQVANSNIVLSLYSRCLVLVLFLSDSSFLGLLHEILSVLQSCRKYFCTKCTLNLRMYPLPTGDLKNYEFS